MNDGSNDFMNKVLVECYHSSLFLCNDTSRVGI